MDGLTSSGLAQIKSDPAFTIILLMKLSMGDPSHSKTGVGKFATGKGGWDITTDGTTG